MRFATEFVRRPKPSSEFSEFRSPEKRPPVAILLEHSITGGTRMNVVRFGSLAICLVIAGVVTAEGDNSQSMNWKSPGVPGELPANIEETRKMKMPIDPGFWEPVSMGEDVKDVGPFKTKDDETIDPGGLRSLVSSLVVVICDVIDWISDCPPKVVLGVVIAIIFVLKKLKGEPV